MAVCTFFGHSKVIQLNETDLKLAIVDMIVNKNVNRFYVGNNGEFDSLVRKCLKEVKNEFPDIDYSVVLAYMPGRNNGTVYEDYSDTIIFEGMEKVLPKYAIIERNKRMIEKSDYVITYVKRAGGGAARFKEFAEKKGKIVINIAK